MIRFNLLPYRVSAQRHARRLWSCVLLAAAIAGCMIVFAVAHVIGLQRQTQLDGNVWLREAHRQLDAEIGRARMLQRETALLLARTRYIEQLAQQRLQTPRMLMSLATQLPPGAYLERITQHARQFTLDGYAASSIDVNALLENLNRTEQAAASIAVDTTAETGEATLRVAEPRARLFETHTGEPGQPLAFSLVLTLEGNP